MKMQTFVQPVQVTVPRKIFRAYDIRGNVTLLTAELVRQIALALASHYILANQKQVVLGFDARLDSERYSQMIAEVLQHAGLEVISIGCVSSPLLYFAALKYAGNGVMVTASHNPSTDNGIKWLSNGLPPTPSEIQGIADRIEQQDFVTLQPVAVAAKVYSAFWDYGQFIQHDIQLKAAHRISLDGFHGSAGWIAKAVLQQFGCQVDALHCEANGHFPLGAPDPSAVERLAILRQSVLAQGSVMGIALDGDGDRVVILDEQGNMVSPDRLMSLFAKMCLIEHPQAEIVCDVKCSTMIAQTVQRYAGRFRMIRTGSSFLRHYLCLHRAHFGGEFAGHYVFNDGRGKGFDDGLYAALRLLEYLERTGQSLTQALAEFPERIATPDMYIASHGIDGQMLMQCLEQQIDLDNIQLCTIDGIRLDFPYGFGIIRPSNTGEYFTVRFDADTAQHLAHIRQTFMHILQPNFPQIAQAIATAH